MHLWARLPEGADDQEVAERAARAGVLVGAGRHWFPAEPPGAYLRLSFATVRPEAVGEAVDVLAHALTRSAAGGE